MTGFARLIVVFSLFIRLAFSMENMSHGNTTTNSLNDNSFSVVSDRKPNSFIFPSRGILEQKVDHFDEDNQDRWDQDYWTINNFYKKKMNKRMDVYNKKPVFLFICKTRYDGHFQDNVEDKILIQWAEKFEALIFQIDHRFYGLRLPILDYKTETLRKYLTIGQVLSDYAYFINAMLDKMDTDIIYSTNKWIVFGGGYAGTLAAFMRHFYPELVHGAVASSAYFPTNFFQPEYYDRVGDNLKKFGKNNFGLKCYNHTNQAFIKLSQAFDSEDVFYRESIKTTFGLNDSFDPTNDLHVNFFFEKLTSKIASIVNDKEKITSFCNSLSSPDGYDVIEKLANGLKKLYVEFEKTLKITADYDKINAELRDEEASPNRDRLKYHQKCTELGGFAVPESNHQPFIYRVQRKFLFKFYCTDPFGLDYSDTLTDDDDSSEELTINVKFSDFKKFRKNVYFSNTVFIDGELDLMIDSAMSHYNPMNNEVIVIKGADSCDDMKAYDSPTPPHIKKAQNKIEKLINKWINEKPSKKKPKDSSEKKLRSECWKIE